MVRMVGVSLLDATKERANLLQQIVAALEAAERKSGERHEGTLFHSTIGTFLWLVPSGDVSTAKVV